MEVFRASLDDDAGEEGGSASVAKRRAQALDGIEQHLGMAPLFGAGTLVVVRQPAGLLAEKEARARLLDLVGGGPAGQRHVRHRPDGLRRQEPGRQGVLRDAIADAGRRGAGVQDARLPASLEPWLVKRAEELEIELQPRPRASWPSASAATSASPTSTVGAAPSWPTASSRSWPSTGPAAPSAPEDVEALVTETIPGSTWAFLDAVGARAGASATTLAERLLADGTPLPVLVSQLHRRLRDLILVREHLDAGSTPPQIVKELKLQPFRAKKLAEQAGAWSLPALEAATVELLALDLRSKGITLDGSTLQVSEAIDALTVQTWIARYAMAAAR